MNFGFVPAGLTTSELNKIVDKLGGIEGARKFLRGELVVSDPLRSWREEDNIIYFSVTSNGRSGREWINHFKAKGLKFGAYTESVLLSPNFRPTSGVTTEIAVFKGVVFYDGDWTTKRIRDLASESGLVVPNPEVACLIRDMFLDDDLKEMRIWRLLVMHEPVNDRVNAPNLLVVRCDKPFMLDSFYDGPNKNWYLGNGFAFAIPPLN